MRRNNKTLFVFVAMLATLAVVMHWLRGSQEQEIDTQVLSLDSPGCVATTPDGQPLKQALAEGLTTIPEGTTITTQCFGRKFKG